MERDEARRRIREQENPFMRIVTGIAVLAAGIILWLDHLHRLNAGDYFQWWSLLLIGYALAHVAVGRWRQAIVFFILGLIFLPHVPFMPYLRISQVLAVWPLLITFAGITLVMQALRPSTGVPVTFRTVAVMGGNERVVGSSRADEIPRGDVVAVMGGCEIDLTSAAPAREVVIDALVFWGGVEIKIPRGWAVESHMAVLLGALVNNAKPSIEPNPPRVVIRGSVIMGAIEVKNPREVIA